MSDTRTPKRGRRKTRATVAPVACTLEVEVREGATSAAAPLDPSKITVTLVAESAPSVVIKEAELRKGAHGELVYRYTPVRETWYKVTAVRKQGDLVATRAEKVHVDVRERPAKEGGRVTKVKLTLCGVPTIDLLDAHGAVIDPANRSIGIALFDGAYTRDFDGRPAPLGPADTSIQSPILNEAAEADNFAGSDSRRFYIRIRHEGAEGVQTLPDGKRYVHALWYTRYPDGKVCDDNRGKREITLVERSPGEYRSVGLVMVHWEADRDLATHCGIAGRYPAGSEKRPHGSTDHRVRQIGMFGDMVVEYPAVQSDQGTPRRRIVARPFLPRDRKVLMVQIFVGSRAGTSQPVTTPAEVFDIGLHRFKRAYEAIGVCVQTTMHPDAEVYVASGHAGIRKVTGGPEGRDLYYVISTSDFLGNRDLDAFSAEDVKALAVNFPDRGFTPRVLYVGQFLGGANGYGYNDVDFPSDPAHGSCASIPETAGNPAHPPSVKAIMAHEVGHIVTNKSIHFGTNADQTFPAGFPQFGGHFSRPAAPGNRYKHYYNLMGGTGFRLWDVDVQETSDTSPPTTDRFNQVKAIRDSKYVKPA